MQLEAVCWDLKTPVPADRDLIFCTYQDVRGQHQCLQHGWATSPGRGGQVRGRGRRWTEEDPSPQHLLQAPLLYGWQDLAPSKLELSPRDMHPSRRVFFPDVGPYRQPGTRSCRRTPCLADKVPVRRTPARCRPRCPWGKSTEQTVTHRLPYCRDTHAWHLRSQACHGDSNK